MPSLASIFDLSSSDLGHLVAISASVADKELLYAALGARDAVMISAAYSRIGFALKARIRLSVSMLEKHKNECHSDVSAALRLIEVMRSRVVVNVNVDFVDTG